MSETEAGKPDLGKPEAAKPELGKPVAKMSFEDAMRELERVVDLLERGDVALEESIRLYERGAELKAHCETKLKAAEEKVEQLTLDASGQPKGSTPVEGL